MIVANVVVGYRIDAGRRCPESGLQTESLTMDANTRKILITIAVVGFVLTSTFTWGVISAGIDYMQGGVEGARTGAAWTISWILAHANALVPVFFLGFIFWVTRQKAKE